MTLKEYKKQLLNYLENTINADRIEETVGQANYDHYVSKKNFNFDLAIQHRTNAFRATVRREFCEELINFINSK